MKNFVYILLIQTEFIGKINDKCGYEGSLKIPNPLETTWIKREADDGSDDFLSKITPEEKERIVAVNV